MSERVDWCGLMRVGLGLMRMPPEVFWGMTPREISRALEGAGLAPVGAAALRRGDLDALIARFPDTEEERHER
ncbi:MAG TPA: rcc01693 family protein [Thermohalobaculum sp.]|nr:rcc01693 family protein [Thermohalobaculum sp.]